MNYSDEQKADIEARTTKANETLKELNLVTAAVIAKVAVGEQEINGTKATIFADQIIPYLADTLYQPTEVKAPEEPIASPFVENNETDTATA